MFCIINFTTRNVENKCLALAGNGILNLNDNQHYRHLFICKTYI